MHSAVDSAIGLPRRSTSASWIDAFLMPAEVRRRFMVRRLADQQNLIAAVSVSLPRSDRATGREMSMSDTQGWKVARLDDLERRGRDIPVREHLGIRAFGINAYTPSEDGTLIGEHDEAGTGQEELYFVLDGNATFEVDGQTVDAPAGTFVLVQPESRRRATETEPSSRSAPR